MPRTTRPRVLNSDGSPRIVRAPSPRRLQSLVTDPAASLPPLDPFVAKAESPRLRAAPSRPGLPPGRVGSERSLPRGRHHKNRAAIGRVPGPLREILGRAQKPRRPGPHGGGGGGRAKAKGRGKASGRGKAKGKGRV